VESNVTSKKEPQKSRFLRLSRRPYNTHGIESAEATYCTIYNVCSVNEFMTNLYYHLHKETSGKFINDEIKAQKAISALAEFTVWHLVLEITKQFEEKFARSGQNNQWFSTGSPNFIDIIALKEIEGRWRFFAIEIKWSEKCDYYGQVRASLVEDINKLYRNDYAEHRLATHISALKAQLLPYFSAEDIEDIFEDIDAGTNPSEAYGINFWGFFVSDWGKGDYSRHNPDDHFKKLMDDAVTLGWTSDCIKGFMINIDDGLNTLKKVAMGKIS